MINRVVLVGRLVADPELRTTGSGISVGSFRLAVNRPYKDKNGNREADFVSCIIWRKSAEVFSNFTKKGTLIAIDGRLQTRNYKKKDGNTVYVTEVVVENWSFLEKKENNSSNSNSTPTNTNASVENQTTQAVPANVQTEQPTTESASTRNAEPDPAVAAQSLFDDPSTSIDITDDDLPF